MQGRFKSDGHKLLKLLKVFIKMTEKNIEKIAEVGEKMLMDIAGERFVALRGATEDYQKNPTEGTQAHLVIAIAGHGIAAAIALGSGRPKCSG